MMTPETPRYPIESVDNALQLLLAVHERGSISVADGSKLLGVARSTAHRLLAMLQYRGMVQQDPVLKTYLPGPVLVEMGITAVRHIDIRGQVVPRLESLVEDVGETAHLVVRRGASVTFLDCVESEHALRAGSRTGTMLPAHCTAAGKVLLAELPDEAVRALYTDGLPSLTGRSLATVDVLVAQLRQVRQRGYAVNLGESENELNATAAAIRDRRGLAVGAITVAGPGYRLPEARLAEVAVRVRRAAAAISESVEADAQKSPDRSPSARTE